MTFSERFTQGFQFDTAIASYTLFRKHSLVVFKEIEALSERGSDSQPRLSNRSGEMYI